MNLSPKTPTDLLTEHELAKLLRVSVRTLQRLRAKGQSAFPFCNVGQRTLYARDAVMARFNGFCEKQDQHTNTAIYQK